MYHMFKSYFKIAWRNLRKNKLYTFVNITGLTVSIVSCILIHLYIAQELSYDKINNARHYTITGVAKYARDNSHIHFNLVAYSTYTRSSHKKIWSTPNYITYSLLAHPQDLPTVQKQATAYMATDKIRRETSQDG